MSWNIAPCTNDLSNIVHSWGPSPVSVLIWIQRAIVPLDAFYISMDKLKYVQYCTLNKVMVSTTIDKLSLFSISFSESLNSAIFFMCLCINWAEVKTSSVWTLECSFNDYFFRINSRIMHKHNKSENLGLNSRLSNIIITREIQRHAVNSLL